MDIITKLADKFVQHHLTGRITEYSKIIDSAKEQVYNIDDELDKIKFLNIVLEGNNKTYEPHRSVCKNPEKCQINFAHESIAYFLGQELSRFGIKLSQDTFTVEEKEAVDSKLDKILKDLEDLKMGHQIIYDDLLNEINELRTLYLLGKKKWHQLLAGKCLEMVAGGVISETVSKQIIATVEPTFTKLING